MIPMIDAPVVSIVHPYITGGIIILAIALAVGYGLHWFFKVNEEKK